MALVGTLCFCTDCGDLLLRAALSEKEIICHTCGTTNISPCCPMFLLMSHCRLTPIRQMASSDHQHFQAQRIPLEAAAKAQRRHSRHFACRNQGRQGYRVSVREVWRARVEICRVSAEKCGRRHYALVSLSKMWAPISTGELDGKFELCWTTWNYGCDYL